jgi:membrane protease YdiL (CAAX protease family)
MSTDESETHEQSPDELFLTAVLFESALAVIAILLGWALGPSARDLIPELQADQVWPIFSGLGLGLVAAVPIVVVIELIRHIPWEPIRELERLTEQGMVKSLLELTPLELIVISICAGIGEELLFRGWMMYWLADGLSLFAPEVPSQHLLIVALLVSSLVFGFFHPITRLYVVLAALMGVYFGLLVIWTGNLLVPITAHAAYDAAQLLLTKREVRRENEVKK